MLTIVRPLAILFAASLPFTASAQGDAAAYCGALIQKYHRYVVKIGGHSPNPGGVDGSVAVEQCRAGNTAAGIPVLERKLLNAKVELPARG